MRGEKEMTQIRHASIPWVQRETNLRHISSSQNGEAVAVFANTGDAELAVKAVNAQDEIIDALRDTLRMLQAAHMQCGIHHEGHKRVIKARAVLAKAEGRS